MLYSYTFAYKAGLVHQSYINSTKRLKSFRITDSIFDEANMGALALFLFMEKLHGPHPTLRINLGLNIIFERIRTRLWIQI